MSWIMEVGGGMISPVAGMQGSCDGGGAVRFAKRRALAASLLAGVEIVWLVTCGEVLCAFCFSFAAVRMLSL